MELQISHLSSSTLMDLQTVNRNCRLHRYLHLRNKRRSTRFVPVTKAVLFLLAVHDERTLSEADHIYVDDLLPHLFSSPSQDCIQLNQYKLKSEIGKVSEFSAICQ